MFESNAKLFWKFKHKAEPTFIDFMGAFPEDNPLNYVYRVGTDVIFSHVVIQMSNNGLMTREIHTQDELDYLYKQGIDESGDNSTTNKE